MRLVLAALVLMACSNKGAPEPAWPKSAGTVTPETWEEDGGESIDPVGDTSIENSETDVGEEAVAVDAGAPADAGDGADEMIIDDSDPPPDAAPPDAAPPPGQ